MNRISQILSLVLFLFWLVPAWSQPKPFNQLSAKEKKLYNEHIIEGQPDDMPVLVRQGYVVQYSDKYRIPMWSAYHVKPDYLNTPKRERKYKTFRKDPDVINAVVTDDYTGSSYARGHLAPYFAMGGDRDKNGVYANAQVDSEDPYDDVTVFQANYMTNIAPQSHDALNGAGGPWYKLETAIRKKLVTKNKMELNIIAGSIINNPDSYFIMINKHGDTDIAVPDQFFQVIIYRDRNGKYTTAGFLFPHYDDPEDLPSTDLMDYLVPVDDIEKITGLDFLNKLSLQVQTETESKSNFDFWYKLINQ